MPSTVPSFASAAAASGRQQSADNPDSSEWTRRPNGVTQTFRRSSQATLASSSASSHHRDSSNPTAASSSSTTTQPGAYVPPHINAMRNGASADHRYSKSQLLDLFKDQRQTGSFDDGLSNLFVGDFEPPHSNGASTAKWSRRDDSVPNPDVCWDRSGALEPLGLVEMTEDERQLFTSSVNSPLKAPNPTAQREGGTSRDGQGLRKLSISQAQLGIGGLGAASPSSSRPGTRRRDTSEFQPHAINTKLGAQQDEEANLSSPAVSRRRTDTRDGGNAADDQDRDPGQLKRTQTASYGSQPASPWSTTPSSGAFGAFSFGGGGGQTADKRPGISRGESRFRSLMSRDSSDDVKGARGSLPGLGRVDEQGDLQQRSSEAVGSAALGGDSPPVPGDSDFNSQRPRNADAAAFPGLGQQRSASGFGGPSHFPQQSYSSEQAEEPTSPTFTNPYQSPEQRTSRLEDAEPDEPDLQTLHLPGLGGFGGPFAREQAPGQGIGGSMGFGQGPFDREQAAAAQARGFPGLGNLGGLGGLSSPGGWASGGMAQQRPGLPEHMHDSTIRSPRDIQSPGLSGLGGNSGAFGPLGPSSLGSIGRGNSRLGSLFPSQMQDQMRTGRDNFSETTDRTDDREGHGQGVAPGTISRDTNSPFHRGSQDDPSVDLQKSSYGEAPGQSYSPGPMHIGASQPGGLQRMPSAATVPSSQPPAAQQKTMVMPDRIRWIYRDPQGNTQGPWSGLEMHDWYRAGFFSPELLVKKVEDPDFEPLAQLIRRIGNSREPFLVPQIGIPGPPSSTPGGWPNQSVAQPPSTAQPPFAGSFPSFGTTLTAEQQNALERRKQEEQYLMARQKEHLAQQQLMAKQMQISHPHGFSQQLQTRSSAQSLNSQPSYGSMTSPVGYQGQHHQHQSHGSMETSLRSGGGLGSGAEGLGDIKEEQIPGMLEQLKVSGGPQTAYGRSHYGENQAQNQRAAMALADRARLELEQAEAAQRGDIAPQDAQARLQQFNDLREDLDEDGSSADHYDLAEQRHLSAAPQATHADETPQGHGLSLTEQVQKAASAKQSPMTVAAEAPAPSTSPLPAPAARRNRNNVADAFAAESPASASPSVETPSASIAPWAKDITVGDGTKQPSLKEIQEAEARRAAKQEEVAAAARRAALEREIAAQPIAPAPGLPASSTWGNIDTAPVTGASAWAKPAVPKTPANTINKKTLQQIQKEEEALARRQKAAAIQSAVASTTNVTQSASAGKRYADLAGKAASPSPSAGGGAWTTVGQSGKTKAPALPPAAPTRSISGTGMSAVAVAASPARPKATVTQSRSTPVINAMEEFKRWAVSELRPELNKGLLPEGVFDDLLNMPVETDFITEAVHQVSSSIDSRHFAEEFVRRRGLAEKGKTVPSGSNPSSHSAADGKGNGGWSEVARKGPAPVQREDSSSSNTFKIVPAKKKPGKK